MPSIFDAADAYALRAGQQINISQRTATLLITLPLVLSFFFALFLTIPETRDFTKDMLRENRPVELLTFVFLMIGGVWSLKLTGRSKQKRDSWLLTAFYGVTGVLLFFVGMEEIAWGQWFFGFETPEDLAEINVQGEVTLHNIEGIHGKTEFIRLFIGFAGMAMVLFSIHPLRKLRPPMLLFTWFATITVLAIPDLYYDYALVYTNAAALFDMMSELNEMFAAGAVLIFFRYTQTLIGK